MGRNFGLTHLQRCPILAPSVRCALAALASKTKINALGSIQLGRSLISNLSGSLLRTVPAPESLVFQVFPNQFRGLPQCTTRCRGSMDGPKLQIFLLL